MWSDAYREEKFRVHYQMNDWWVISIDEDKANSMLGIKIEEYRINLQNVYQNYIDHMLDHT